MLPIRQTIMLSGGAVVLRAWGAGVADAHLLDLLALSTTLALIREDWQEYQRGDIEKPVWAAFWRLVHASIEAGSALPEKLTWNDRLTLLEAMRLLNDEDGSEGKLTALAMWTQQKAAKLSQGQMMTA